MTNDLQELNIMLKSLIDLAQYPFWQKLEFWISVIIGIGGLVFSILAFIEAKSARRAAIEAGKIVKIQTITIDLTEISQKLDKLRTDIHFNEARDLLTEISRRLRRIVSPFQKDKELSETITALLGALSATKESLNSVRPANPEKEADAPYAVYNAIEGDFATINNIVADLLGLFEKRSINLGDDNANT